MRYTEEEEHLLSLERCEQIHDVVQGRYRLVTAPLQRLISRFQAHRDEVPTEVECSVRLQASNSPN